MKKVLFGILAILILIQFIRPDKNDSGNMEHDISVVNEIPTQVSEILKTSCNDCHSNKTQYPWYNQIAPVSWFLAQHVNEAKEHLNFSEWTTYNNKQKDHLIKDLKEVLKENEMPLESYVWIHKDAKMTKEQYQVMLNWVNTLK